MFTYLHRVQPSVQTTYFALPRVFGMDNRRAATVIINTLSVPGDWR